jgi:hypothetical protein
MPLETWGRIRLPSILQSFPAETFRPMAFRSSGDEGNHHRIEVNEVSLIISLLSVILAMSFSRILQSMAPNTTKQDKYQNSDPLDIYCVFHAVDWLRRHISLCIRRELDER